MFLAWQVTAVANVLSFVALFYAFAIVVVCNSVYDHLPDFIKYFCSAKYCLANPPYTQLEREAPGVPSTDGPTDCTSLAYICTVD